MEHFHSIEQGCEIIVKYKKKFGVVYRSYTKCSTHKVKICRCGYVMGWHNNECSKKLYPKGKQDLTHLLDSSKMKSEV